MAVDSPRSVADATRFTANTPHAHAKARKPVAQSTASSSTRGPAAASRTGAPHPPRRPAPVSAGGIGGQKPESLDERVRRLRAAHLAARNHEVSRMDKVISSSRRYMDAAHRYTVMGLIGFSGMLSQPPTTQGDSFGMLILDTRSCPIGHGICHGRYDGVQQEPPE